MLRSRTSRAVALAGLLIAGPTPANADVVLEWNAIAMATLSGQNALQQFRVITIAQLSVFEAVNAITGDYTPYLGTVKAPAHASVEAATVAAAHRVLTHYVPEQTPSLDERRAASLAAIPDGSAKEDGIAAGVAAAEALIALRENDGSQPPRFHFPSSTHPGVWQLTPSCTPAGGTPTGGVLLHLKDMTPFGLRSGDQFRVAPPPSLKSARYRRDFDEVRAVGAADSAQRPKDRADVARFYAAVQSTPVWNSVAVQIATTQGRSLSENARALALVHMAVTDGLVAVFDSKYKYVFWRPETAIDAFTPFITTPCHPSYPSAHAAGSYAAREVLRRIYGRAGHAIDLSTPAVPDVQLHYTDLTDITSDIDDARVFGGIHFRFDQRAGARLGRHVGAYLYKHQLRPVRVCDFGDQTEEMDEADETEHDVEGDR